MIVDRTPMGASRLTVDLIERAYAAWLGPSETVVQTEPDSATGDVPPRLDVLYFPLLDDPAGPFAYIATAGLSTRRVAGTTMSVELLLGLPGGYPWSTLLAVGLDLAALGLRGITDGARLEPGGVVDDVVFALYPGRTHALLTRYGRHLDRHLPPGHTIEMLALCPLYPREAAVAREVGVEEMYRRGRERGISGEDWAEPERPEVALYEYPAGLVEATLAARATAVARTDDSMDEAGGADLLILRLWGDIAAWYRVHAPRAGKSVQPGASEEQVRRLEALLSCLLPADYRASLRAHNGDADLSAWHYLSADGVWRAASALREQTEAGAFTGRTVIGAGRGVIQPLWWHRGWAPIARDQGGRLLCLDLDPGLGGVVGQLIAWDPDTGPVATGHRSFDAWLQEYRADLLAGRYHVDADGYIAAP